MKIIPSLAPAKGWSLPLQTIKISTEIETMKCWFCEKEARGTCAVCGRALCYDHAHIHDELTLTKTDTSTGHATYYNAYGTLKCSDCRLEWKSVGPGGR